MAFRYEIQQNNGFRIRSEPGEHPTFAEIVFLWGGHPARPVAVAGETPAPQEDVFA